jgi:hypothetical protein
MQGHRMNKSFHAGEFVTGNKLETAVLNELITFRADMADGALRRARI